MNYYFIIRLIICFILSFMIGIEREIIKSNVGLRTNIIVCIGAYLFVSSAYFDNNVEKIRIASQVVSGIGFLGAGAIATIDDKINGLNTAATIWCVDAIGVLVALKLIFEASFGTIAIIFTNIFVRKIKKMIFPNRDNNDF